MDHVSDAICKPEFNGAKFTSSLKDDNISISKFIRGSSENIGKWIILKCISNFEWNETEEIRSRHIFSSFLVYSDNTEGCPYILFLKRNP